jgi:hypothetical protein
VRKVIEGGRRREDEWLGRWWSDRKRKKIKKVERKEEIERGMKEGSNKGIEKRTHQESNIERK